MEGKPGEGWHRVDGCYDATPRHDFHPSSEHVFTSTAAIASVCDGLEPVAVDVDIGPCGYVSVLMRSSSPTLPLAITRASVFQLPQGFSGLTVSQPCFTIQSLATRPIGVSAKLSRLCVVHNLQIGAMKVVSSAMAGAPMLARWMCRSPHCTGPSLLSHGDLLTDETCTQCQLTESASVYSFECRAHPIPSRHILLCRLAAREFCTTKLVYMLP